MAINAQKMDNAAVANGWSIDEVTAVSRIYQKHGETVTVIMSLDLPTRAYVLSPQSATPSYLRSRGIDLVQAVVNELEA